ncbi:hypothetical protein MSAN_00253100 [Mycena sanguinolenta]|uniref:Uncharacterized protein n=1 Tax=Mycena sanguinolenta TaxID=230812 RepID=A0A8H6ZJ12_9AGAR|nr:hypothetical protein MSAN_00253100 [Mycena sanguinolenta]
MFPIGICCSNIHAIIRRIFLNRISLALVITTRIRKFRFTPIVINIVASNPSPFPDCRVYSASASEIGKLTVQFLVLLVPCLRAIFDALSAIAILTKLNPLGELGPVGSELCQEGGPNNSALQPLLLPLDDRLPETQDLIIIFLIMAMEAVFVQVQCAPYDAEISVLSPMIRCHRSELMPGIISLHSSTHQWLRIRLVLRLLLLRITALLATRFIMHFMLRVWGEEDDEVRSFVSARRSFESTPPIYQTPRSSVTSLDPEGPHLPPGLPGSPATTLSSEGSRLPPDPDLSVLFPAWPPVTNETESYATHADPEALVNWPSVTQKKNSFTSLNALESRTPSWPPKTFEFESSYDNVDPQAVIENPQCNYPEPV